MRPSHHLPWRKPVTVKAKAVCTALAILAATSACFGAIAWIDSGITSSSSSAQHTAAHTVPVWRPEQHPSLSEQVPASISAVSVRSAHVVVTPAHVRTLLDKDKGKDGESNGRGEAKAKAKDKDKDKGEDKGKGPGSGRPAESRGPNEPMDSSDSADSVGEDQARYLPQPNHFTGSSESTRTASRSLLQSVSAGAVPLPVAANAADNTIIVFTQQPGNSGNSPAAAAANPPGNPQQPPVVAAGPSQFNIVICPGDPRCPAQPPPGPAPNPGSSSISGGGNSVITSQQTTSSSSPQSSSAQNVQVIDLRQESESPTITSAQDNTASDQGDSNAGGTAAAGAASSDNASGNMTAADNNTVVTTGNATLQGPPVTPDPPRSGEFVPDVIRRSEGPDRVETLTVRLLLRGNISQFTSNESFVIINTTAAASGTPANRWSLTMQQQQQQQHNMTNRKLLQQQQQGSLLIVIMSVNTYNPQLVWYRLTRPDPSAAASSGGSPANAASNAAPGSCSTEYCTRLKAAGVTVDSSGGSNIQVSPSYGNLLEPSTQAAVLPQINTTAARPDGPEVTGPGSANNESDLQRFLADQLRADSQTTHRITQMIAAIATSIIGLFLVWLAWYKRRSIMRCLGKIREQPPSDEKQSESTEQLAEGFSKSSSAVTDRAAEVSVTPRVRHKVRVVGRKRPAGAVTMTAATPALAESPAATMVVTAADAKYCAQADESFTNTISNSLNSETSNIRTAASSSPKSDGWGLDPIGVYQAGEDRDLRSSGTIRLAAPVVAGGGGSDFSSPVSLHHYTGVPAYSKYDHNQHHQHHDRNHSFEHWRGAIRDQDQRYDQPYQARGGLSRQEADNIYSSDHCDQGRYQSRVTRPSDHPVDLSSVRSADHGQGRYQSRVTAASDHSADRSSVRSADVKLPRWGSPMGRGLQGLDEEEHRVLAGYLAKLQSSGKL